MHDCAEKGVMMITNEDALLPFVFCLFVLQV